EDLADELPFGAGLVGDELHAEDLRRGLAGLFGRSGELDAAALAAAASMDLGFDDAAAAQFLADPRGFVRIGRHPSLGCRDSIPAQDLIGLIFMDLQYNLHRDVSPRDVVRETDGRRNPPTGGRQAPGTDASWAEPEREHIRGGHH